MEIIKKGFFPAPTDITGKPNMQIEDWSKDYPGTFAPCATLAIYPIAHGNSEKPFAPQIHKRFRFEFQFETEREANIIFDFLESGKITPKELNKILPKSASVSHPEYFELL